MSTETWQKQGASRVGVGGVAAGWAIRAVARPLSGSPVRVAIAVVVAEQVGIPLCILGQLQGLVDRVQQVVGQVRHEVDQLCAAWPDGSSSRVAAQRTSAVLGPAACVLLSTCVLLVELGAAAHPPATTPSATVAYAASGRVRPEA